MPNGHGGIPRFGAPLFIFLLTVLIAWWERQTASIFARVLSLIGAGIFGWRLAYHLMLWNVSEYDGNYASPNQKKKARRKYVAATMVLVPVAVLGVYFRIL